MALFPLLLTFGAFRPLSTHNDFLGSFRKTSAEISIPWNSSFVARVFPGRFVAGWARRASTGLVGIARHDGELGANQAIEFVKGAPDSGTMAEADIRERLEAKGLRPVDKADLVLLARAEENKAGSFLDNDSMLRAIAEERESAGVPST